MNDTSGSDASGTAPESLPRSRWPEVLGIVGLILSVVIFIDKADDLLTLTWTEEEWTRLVGRELADLILRTLPPLGWRLASILAHVALAVLLLTGSLALRNRRRSGVSRCQVWAALAIGWVVVEMGWAVWWLSRFEGEIMGVTPADWPGYAAFGIAVALVVLLAYPVFLLTWLGRSDVRAEYEGWPG